MNEIDYIIFASYGNDSIALIQWAHDKKLKNVVVLFNDTGWASEDWMARVDAGEKLAASYGFIVARTEPEGMFNLAKRKKSWPGGGYVSQFCTKELKILPSLEWMNFHDPKKLATCLIGKRREESAARKTTPEHVCDSDIHEGRDLWHPLVRHTENMRNELVKRAGFDVLPHRSMECFPCINSNINDLRMPTEERVTEIEVMEIDMGYTSKGNPRVLFRPKRHKGATGIREVWKWAKLPRTDRDQQDLFGLGKGSGCDSGFCGG